MPEIALPGPVECSKTTETHAPDATSHKLHVTSRERMCFACWTSGEIGIWTSTGHLLDATGNQHAKLPYPGRRVSKTLKLGTHWRASQHYLLPELRHSCQSVRWGRRTRCLCNPPVRGTYCYILLCACAQLQLGKACP